MMCQFVVALFGLYALVVGRFRLSRTIAVQGNRARLVGLILVAPVVLTFLMVMATGNRTISDAELERLNTYGLVLMVLSFIAATYVTLTAPKPVPPVSLLHHTLPDAPAPPVPVSPPANSVTVAEAAAMLGISESEVHNLIQTGQIRSMYLNMRDFIPLESVQEYRGRMQP